MSQQWSILLGNAPSKGINDGKKRDFFYQDQGAGKKEQNQNCLLTMDDGVVNWGEHTEEEVETNHALMAISSNNEVSLCSKTCIDSYNKLKTLCDEQTNQLGEQEVKILAYDQAVKKLEAQVVTFQKQQLSLNEQLTFQANELYEKDEKLKKYRRIGMKAVKEKEQLQKIVDSWKDSSKSLWKLVDSGMSSTSKVGLGFEIKSNDDVLSYEEEMNRTVFNCTEEELTKQQKQRKAQVQFEAQHYTKEDWDAIRAKLEANAELTKNVIGKKLPEEDFAKKMVELVNQRKKLFAEERAKARRKISKKQRIDDKDVPVEEKVTEVKEEEPVIRTGKRKKQKARKGINVDKSPQGDSETDEEESVEAMNPTPLDTKSNIVANWKIFQQGERSIYQIIRANGADTVYMSFGAMLKDFTREDLIKLYRLVMQKYGTNRPEDVYDRVLWSDLRTMFDPPLNEDAIWRATTTTTTITTKRQKPFSKSVSKPSKSERSFDMSFANTSSSHLIDIKLVKNEVLVVK
ncbi:hypothetical protein Tco_0512652, partial [Tanacetum coccineum]